MSAPVDSPTYGRGRPFTKFLQRHCLWLLVGCYALAALLPAPGRAMRSLEWSVPFATQSVVTFPLLLLALLLLCAALQTDMTQIRAAAERPWVLVAGLLAVWLGPALLVLPAAVLLPALVDRADAIELLVGLLLVASMPVANSSVGWTQAARGNLALGLALVLVSIFLCPWVTPHLLATFHFSLSTVDGAHLQLLMDKFSGSFFIVWVIVPTAAGLACRYLCGPQRVAAATNWIAATSVAALLLLNYVNAALALPDVLEQSQPTVLLATALLATALAAIGLVAGWLIARWLDVAPDQRAALLFGLSMKHTGLALLLAGAVLPELRLAILVIVLATLAQHLLAGIVEWRLQGAK